MEGILTKMLGRDNLIHISKCAWILKRHKIYLTIERGEQRTLLTRCLLCIWKRDNLKSNNDHVVMQVWIDILLIKLLYHDTLVASAIVKPWIPCQLSLTETRLLRIPLIIQLDDLGWLACRLLVVFTNKTAVSLWSFFGEGSVCGVERGRGKHYALLRDFKTDVADRRAWPYGQEWWRQRKTERKCLF